MLSLKNVIFFFFFLVVCSELYIARGIEPTETSPLIISTFFPATLRKIVVWETSAALIFERNDDLSQLDELTVHQVVMRAPTQSLEWPALASIPLRCQLPGKLFDCATLPCTTQAAFHFVFFFLLVGSDQYLLAQHGPHSVE